MLTFRRSNRYMTLRLSFISTELAFDNATQAKEFLDQHRAGTFFKNPNSADDEKILDCKAAHPTLVQIFEEKYRKVQIKGAV